MASELIKKHKIGIYVNGGTVDAPEWVRIKRATDFTRSMNPVTEERDYIGYEHPTTELSDYKPSEELSVAAFKGEKDFELLYKLYKERAIGEDAKREILVVSIFDSTEITDSETSETVTYYYADKAEATIALNEFNTSGSTISATVYENGTPETGYVIFDKEGNPTFTKGTMPTA